MILSPDQWQQLAKSHCERLAPFVQAHLERRKRGQKHPVHDFLWEYYRFKPTYLLRFSPGIGTFLEKGESFLEFPQFARFSQGVALDKAKFPRHRLASAREILLLLESTQTRAPRFDCFGWHEWAMVYRAESVRHTAPLRLSHPEIAALVESQAVKCSHYDAFRFFTPDARNFNLLNPKSNDRPDFEQPGCIHANMDLYKWAFKFAPWMASDIVGDAFLLALHARELDMRAAPYDLSAFGVVPIPVETLEGRREYVEAQKLIAQKAAPVRARLVEAYRELIEVV